MQLTADFHTHTYFSHGKGTILENALEAKKKDLKQIVITDHCYGHSIYGIKRKELPLMKRLCEEAEKETGVKVVLGVETNILGISGKTDMKERDFEYLEVYLAGIHKCIMYDRLKEWYLLLATNFFARHFVKPSESLIKRNTKVYLNTIMKNPIDILAHPNHAVFCDVVEVAKCCRDYGTYFEIDSRKKHLSDEEWAKVADTGVKFIVDSDAHTPDRVGEIGFAEELIKRVGISEDKIYNINGKMPDYFRFQEYKQKM